MASVKDSLRVKGRVGIVLKDKDGQIKETRDVDNLVVTTGLAYIASRIADNGDTAMSHMALGSGTAAPAATDTALGSQLESRKSVSVSHSGGTVTYTATFGANESEGAVTEAGIFSAATGGTMLCRVKFDVVNKGASDTMSVSWSISVSASA